MRQFFNKHLKDLLLEKFSQDAQEKTCAAHIEDIASFQKEQPFWNNQPEGE